jgi:hypothetical protein
MMVQEIRIRRLAPANLMAILGLRMRLRLGSEELTKGFVPLGCLGKVLNDETSMGNGGHNSFVWRLPKPLYVPPSELLVPSFFTAPGASAPNDYPHEVSYAGYSLEGEPPPSEVHLPWASAWVPRKVLVPADVATSQNYIDISKTGDFPNPFPVPLHVQRFIGRYEFGTYSESANVGQDLAGFLTTVTATDSAGNILVRDPTPFSHLFSPIDRCWTVNAVLPPKGFYRFRMERNFAGYAVYSGTPTYFNLGIGMVGWRTVPYRPS